MMTPDSAIASVRQTASLLEEKIIEKGLSARTEVVFTSDKGAETRGYPDYAPDLGINELWCDVFVLAPGLPEEYAVCRSLCVAVTDGEIDEEEFSGAADALSAEVDAVLEKVSSAESAESFFLEEKRRLVEEYDDAAAKAELAFSMRRRLIFGAFIAAVAIMAVLVIVGVILK